MNPLDDHELLLGSMRAGLTRAEMRQALRRGLNAGDLAWPGANETDAQCLDCIYVDMEVIQVVVGAGNIAAGTPGVADRAGRGVSGV